MDDDRNNAFLLKEMKCVLCVAYMQPPIVQCVTGHSICKQCAEKYSTCARCGKSITGTRNLHLENMATKVKYPCCNFEAGCKNMFLHSELNDHEKRCGNRMYICKLGQCQWNGRRNEIPHHVRYSHPDAKVFEKRSKMLYKQFENVQGHTVRLVRAFGEVFWYHHLKTASAVHWAIQYLGPDVKASSFSFDFKIINPEDENKYVGFKKVNCLNSTDDIDDAFEGARCVKFNLDAVRNFTDEEGNIRWKFKLAKHRPVKEKKEKNKKKKQREEDVQRSSDL